jgi:hypothetical protein
MVRRLLTGARQLAVLRDDPAGAAPVVIVANAGDDATAVTFALAGTWSVLWTTNDSAYGGSGTEVRIEHGDADVRCLMPLWCVAVLERA